MSLRNVELNKTLLTSYVNTQQWYQLIDCLNDKFKISINGSTKEPDPLPVTENVIRTMSDLLNELCESLFKDINDDGFAVLKALFKALRNCVVVNFVAQDLIVKDCSILSNTHSIINNLLSIDTDEANQSLIMILQFISNFVAKNTNNALTVWKVCDGVILRLYQVPKCSYYAAAVLYNILHLNSDLIQFCEDIYGHVMELCAKEEVKTYDIFLLELFIQNPKFFTFYRTLQPIHRMTGLSQVIESDLPSKEGGFPHLEVLLGFSTEFKKKSDCILKTVANYVDQIEPQEVVLLLEILAKLSANEVHCKRLQCDKGLLINCAFLLKSIHTLGKEFQNNFTAIPKLSEVTSVNSGVINQDPAFGFKANLIRLLGNLCWKNRDNQDQAREFDCIPLLLDCCNIDARNPFIIQWSIFAIRNLCENNTENQAVIAGMNKQGVVDSATLHEMGLKLHDDGTNQIGIVSLDSIKK